MATFIHANYILPVLISILREEYEESKIKISVYTDNSKNIMNDVAQLKTDIGMITLSKPKQNAFPELEILSIRRERIRIIVRADHPLAGSIHRTKELKDFPLIIPPSNTDPGHSIRLQITEKISKPILLLRLTAPSWQKR